MWLCHCLYFLFLSLHECRFNEKGNKEKEMIWLCARKGKKKNLTCKAKTIWCWAILLYIHMQLMRRGGLVTILPIFYSLHEIHEEIEDERKQITRYWRKEKKKEAPGPYYKGAHTYVLTSTHKRKETAPQSCPILTPLWTCSMFLDFHPILMLNPMCG